MENRKAALQETYTLGIWLVKPKMENDFIDAWTTFANWSNKNIKGSGTGYLLRDENNPSRFISFGPWDDENTIQQWRDSDAFKDFLTKTKSLCDDFQPNTMKVVSTSNI